MIKQIEKDIKRIYKRLSELERALFNTHEEDRTMLKDIRGDIARFESELTRKQSLIHQIRQDIEIRNIEAEVRIDKLLGQGGDIEDMSEIYGDIYTVEEGSDEEEGEEANED